MHLGNGSLVKCHWVHGSQGHQVMDNRSQVIGDVSWLVGHGEGSLCIKSNAWWVL
jgi:hypothetical protein